MAQLGTEDEVRLQSRDLLQVGLDLGADDLGVLDLVGRYSYQSSVHGSTTPTGVDPSARTESVWPWPRVTTFFGAHGTLVVPMACWTEAVSAGEGAPVSDEAEEPQAARGRVRATAIATARRLVVIEGSKGESG